MQRMNIFCLFFLSPLPISFLLFKLPLLALVLSPVSAVTLPGEGWPTLQASSHLPLLIIFLPPQPLSPSRSQSACSGVIPALGDWKCQYLLVSHKGKALELPLRGRLQNKEVGSGRGRGEQQSRLSWLNGNLLL